VSNVFEFYGFGPPPGTMPGEQVTARWRRYECEMTEWLFSRHLGVAKDGVCALVDGMLAFLACNPGIEAGALIEKTPGHRTVGRLRAYGEIVVRAIGDDDPVVILSRQLESVAGCALVRSRDGIPYVEIAKCHKCPVKLL
jgi:hypothetical protein